MTKIKEVNEFKKPNGKKGWVFILEDGKEGFITNDKPWTYEAGQEVSYTLEVKKKSNGDEYNLFTFGGKDTATQATSLEETPTKRATPSYGLYSAQPKSYDEMKCDLRVAVINTLGVVAAAGKIEPKEMVDYFNEFYPAVDLSIDVLGK